MIDKTIIMEFCKDVGNPNVRSPYSIGDHTYATDGSIFIRVPRIAEFRENPKAPDPEKIEYGKVKAWYLVDNIKPPKAVNCDTCRGKGQNFTCPECDGVGYVYLSNAFSGYEVDCNSCDGNGTIEFCEECQGTGKITSRKPMNFHGFFFDQRHLFLLSKLPNCEIGITGKISPFRFDGGTGGIMPMRHEEGMRHERN